MRAIEIKKFGGPEVLEVAEVPEPVGGPGQTLVEVSAAGVNYADLLRAEGAYGTGEPPFVPGMEVVGRDPSGRRVVALPLEGGGYAERAVVSADDTVEVPDGVDDGQALALLVQGLTAWHLLRTSARIRAGESVVVNAAAGGVGSLAVQLARGFGAGRVIATASTEDKRALALERGADAAVGGDPEGYAGRVREANLGRPVDIVLDANGGAALPAALEALAPFGRLVTYGDSSREGRAPVDPGALAERNLTVSAFWLGPALSLPGVFREPLAELLAMTAEGRLRPLAGSGYRLEDARRAFEDMAARRTTGKVFLRV
ncbi:quinone oxidoreductase family protein [Spirillospora sp. CA-294931]|uniref:quinone oxidoreductase family protein n=1 Tax=Spirillospora sp. CA-294931 TaxID=3240042 RepID=UPI003D8D10C0